MSSRIEIEFPESLIDTVAEAMVQLPWYVQTKAARLYPEARIAAITVLRSLSSYDEIPSSMLEEWADELEATHG